MGVKRLSKRGYFLRIARAVAMRATCPRLSVGAVLVDHNGTIIGTGYNGAARDLDHCLDVGCEVEANHCVRAVHAEVNAIAQAAMAGHQTEGATLYCTHCPCRQCVQVALNAGIWRFVYAEAYGDTHYVNTLAKLDLICLDQYRLPEEQ